jgi:hypothetical protein
MSNINFNRWLSNVGGCVAVSALLATAVSAEVVVRGKEGKPLEEVREAPASIAVRNQLVLPGAGAVDEVRACRSRKGHGATALAPRQAEDR